MDSLWHRDTMEIFAPYMDRMSNLQKFSFEHMSPQAYTSIWQNRYICCSFTKAGKSIQTYVNDIFFLKGQLHSILRSHTPWETLSLKSSPLTESDLKHLSECPSTGQLKNLTLSNSGRKDFVLSLSDLCQRRWQALWTLELELLTSVRATHMSPTLVTSCLPWAAAPISPHCQADPVKARIVTCAFKF